MDELTMPIRGGLEGGLPLRRQEQEFLDGDRRAQARGGDFAGVLQSALDQVSSLEADARNRLHGVMTGQTQELHEVMAAMGKSEVAFNLLLEVRNKLVDAWREISRLPL